MSEVREKLSKRDGQFLPDETETDAQIATYYDAQSEEDMLAEFEEARQAGAVRAGGLDVERTVPVTIRLPVSMMGALKVEAEKRHVRGYQTLLQRWIGERLTVEPREGAS